MYMAPRSKKIPKEKTKVVKEKIFSQEAFPEHTEFQWCIARDVVNSINAIIPIPDTIVEADLFTPSVWSKSFNEEVLIAITFQAHTDKYLFGRGKIACDILSCIEEIEKNQTQKQHRDIHIAIVISFIGDGYWYILKDESALPRRFYDDVSFYRLDWKR